MMRRADREITDFGKIVDITERSDVIRLGLSGEVYPYVVPLSFGYEVRDRKISLYFHGAKEGLKHDLIAKNNRVYVEADIFRNYAKTAQSVTAEYESFIGFGTVCEVCGQEAVKGIDLLLSHCGYPTLSGADCIAMGITRVYKITLDSFTAKQRKI